MAETSTFVRNRSSAWKRIIWLLAAICFCTAVGVLFASSLSFDRVRAIVLSSIPPGYDQRFTPAFYAKVIFGIRLLGMALIAAALALSVWADALGNLISRGFCDLAILGREITGIIYSKNDGILYAAALLAILLWTIGLRWESIEEPIRKDEAYTFMYYAARPIFVGLAYYSANNHLLNTLLMHISTSVFGVSLWALRLPVFTAGILIVPAIYLVMRLYHGKEAALLTAALVSASSPMIEYSFNARGYGLGALFFTAMLLLAGIATLREVTGAWIVLPVMAALALYSVPTMLYGVCGVFLYLLLCAPRERPRTLWALAATAGLTVILYSPVLATVGLSAITSNQWVAPMSSETVWFTAFTHQLVSLWKYSNMGLSEELAILIAIGVMAQLLSRRQVRKVPAAVFLCVAIVACIVLPLQRIVPPRRIWLFLLPVYLGMGAAGWTMFIQKLRVADWVSTILSIVLAGWIGSAVLQNKPFRYSGSEAAGGLSAESVVLGMKDHLLHGDQFICTDFFDSGLDFEMRVHGIPYRPSPSGELLIVTPAGMTAQRTLEFAGISPAKVGSVRKIAHYEDTDVFVGEREPGLSFTPLGSTEMGAFTITLRN